MAVIKGAIPPKTIKELNGSTGWGNEPVGWIFGGEGSGAIRVEVITNGVKV